MLKSLLVMLVAAMATLAGAQASTRASCENWNTREFFANATVSEVEACLSAGAPLNELSQQDIYPLGLAISAALSTVDRTSTGLQIIETLLSAGADPNIQNSWGLTPLHIAAFIYPEPPPNRDSEHISSYVGSRTHVFELLVSAGADVNAHDQNNARAIDYITGACLYDGWLYDVPALISLLIAEGADVNSLPPTDPSPIASGSQTLHRCGIPAVMEMLLDAGADLNAVDYDGDTPLHRAAQVYSVDVVLLLLERGADINARNADGWTPLHMAAGRSRRSDIVTALLDGGADPALETADGRSAWDLIQENEYLNGTAGYERLRDAFSVAHAPERTLTDLNELNWPAFDGVYVLTNDDAFIEIRPLQVWKGWQARGDWRDWYWMRRDIANDVDLELAVSDFRGLFFRGFSDAPVRNTGFFYDLTVNGAPFYGPPGSADDEPGEFRIMNVGARSFYIEPRESLAFEFTPTGLYGYWANINFSDQAVVYAFHLIAR